MHRKSRLQVVWFFSWNTKRLAYWFSTRGDSLPTWHLAVAADISVILSRGQGCHNAQDSPPPHTTENFPVPNVHSAEAEEPQVRDGECPAMASQVSLVRSLLSPRVPTSDLLHSLQTLTPTASSIRLHSLLPCFRLHWTELSSLPDAMSSSPKAPCMPALISTLPLSQLPSFLELSASRLFKEAVPQPLTRSSPSLFSISHSSTCAANRTHITLWV